MKNDIYDEPATVLPLSAGPGNIDTCFASRIFRLGRGGAILETSGAIDKSRNNKEQRNHDTSS